MAKNPPTVSGSQPEHGTGEILITTQSILGKVPYSPSGFGSPVVEAFKIAAKYLDEQGGEGIDSRVEFDFLGAHFEASVAPDRKAVG